MAATNRYDSAHPETWSSFFRRVKNFIASKGEVSDGQKKGIILDALDDKTLDRLERWLEPLTTASADYAQITGCLATNIKSVVNPTVQFIQFTARRQQTGESAAAFADALSVIASSTGFEDRQVRDTLCMHQFIAGVNDPVLQERLLALREPTLGGAIDAACQFEIMRQSAALVQAGPDAVYRVSSGTAAGHNSPTVKCYYCAGSHLAMDCKVDRTKLFCAKCKGKGHVGEACRGGRKKNFKKKGRQQEKSLLVQDSGAQSGPSPGTSAPTAPSPRPAQRPAPQLVVMDTPPPPHTPPPPPPQTECSYFPEFSDSDSEGLFCIGDCSGEPEVPPQDVKCVTVQGTKLYFIVDNGAGRAMVGMPTYLALPDRPPLRPIPKLFHGWDSSMVINVAGYCGVRVNYKGRQHHLPLLVAKGDGPNLLGRNWFKALGFALVETEGINEVIDFNSVLDMVKTFPAVSSPSIGCYKGQPVHIHVDPLKPPKYHRARDVKLPLVTKVQDAIQDNVERGIWVPVDHSTWASGIVPVPKSNGDLRLCADYKSTVNPAIAADPYKSPATDVVLDQLAGGKYFAEIDLKEAYAQIPVDEETSFLLAVNTPAGLHRVTRLPYGIKVAPAIFQRIMDGLLGGIKNVVVYQDNIFVRADSALELKSLLQRVLSILSESGFTVNAQKCTWLTTELRALGFMVSAKGIHPCEDKVQAIKEAPFPQDKEQLQSVLGLISFYERFFQGKAHVLEPLHRLLDAAQEFRWDSKHQAALDIVKDLISSDQVLVPYSLYKPLAVICDASPYGVGAVLCHTVQGPDGAKEERPVRFASRTLSATERRYSQLDKEALAIMFAMKKFSRYLYGRKFLIVTDHKPLIHLFNPTAEIPGNLSPRMTRWAITLSSMDYRIQHRPGADIGNADFLSRLPLPSPSQDLYPDPAGILLLESKLPDVINAQAIVRATAEDPLLSNILKWTIGGWPSVIPSEAKVYSNKRASLSVLNECLLFGDRVVIPSALRPDVIQLIHAAHPGIQCSKAIARSIVWWPGLDEDLTKAVRACQPCQLAANLPVKAQFQPWPKATQPWERVHLDYAGPFMGKVFLIAVDAFSKWPVIKVMPDMSSKSLIKALRLMFADFGRPQTIVTDNGTSFVSQETNAFLQKNGIKLLHTPPYHPSSNGLAERMVQTFKRLMKKYSEGDIQVRLPRVLWAIRSKPSSVTGRSPAEMFMGRAFNSNLSRLHPRTLVHPATDSVQHPMREGSPVWALKHLSNSTRWLPGKVAALRGSRLCDVTLQDGTTLNVHVDHLRPRLEVPAAAQDGPRQEPAPRPVYSPFAEPEEEAPQDPVIPDPEPEDPPVVEPPQDPVIPDPEREDPPVVEPEAKEDDAVPPPVTRFQTPPATPPGPERDRDVFVDPPSPPGSPFKGWSSPPWIAPPPTAPGPLPGKGRGRARGLPLRTTRTGRVVNPPSRLSL